MRCHRGLRQRKWRTLFAIPLDSAWAANLQEQWDSVSSLPRQLNDLAIGPNEKYEVPPTSILALLADTFCASYVQGAKARAGPADWPFGPAGLRRFQSAKRPSDQEMSSRGFEELAVNRRDRGRGKISQSPTKESRFSPRRKATTWPWKRISLNRDYLVMR